MTQFGILVGHVFTFNLGYSYKLNEPVRTIILQKLPKTVLLLGLATLVTVVVAIPLGIFQVLRRNKPSDYALTTLSFIFYATPTFFLGIVLIQLFAIHWHIFPPEAPQGIHGRVDPGGLARPRAAGLHARRRLRRRLQPIYALIDDGGAHRGLRPHGACQRVCPRAGSTTCMRCATRSSRSSRSSGLTLPAIVSGALITEDVFNYPGMGLAFFNAAINNDFPLLIGTTLVAAVATVVGSLLADILYAVLDPRIRYV